MGKQTIKKAFERDGVKTSDTFVVPAGVTKIKVLQTEAYDDCYSRINSQEAHVIASNEGKIYVWGEQPTGNGTLTNQSIPANISGNIRFNKAFLTPDGRTYFWGSNTNGQIGDNTTTLRSIPTEPEGNHRFKKVFRGPGANYGLKHNGELWAWGDNNFGQLGDNTIVDKSTPTLVLGGHTFVDFWVKVPTTDRIWAKTSNGEIYAWGYDGGNPFISQLGFATPGNRSTPDLVTNSLDFVQIQGSTQGGAGLTSDGDLYGWGVNGFGQIGDNTTTPRNTPTLVLGGHTFKSFGMTNTNTAGLTVDGDVYVWGNGGDGMLANGPTLNSESTPLLINGAGYFEKAEKMYIGLNSSVHVISKNDRRLWSWGNQSSFSPVLCTNDTSNKTEPTLLEFQSFNLEFDRLLEIVPGLLGGTEVFGITKEVSKSASNATNRRAWGFGGTFNLGVGNTNANQSVAILGPLYNFASGNEHFLSSVDDVVKEYVRDVVPGQEIQINYNSQDITIPSLGITGSQWTERIEFEWEG